MKQDCVLCREDGGRIVWQGRQWRLVPVLGGLSAQDRIVVRGGLLLDGAASQLM